MCDALAKLAGDTSDVTTIDQRLFDLERKTYDHEIAILALEEVNEQQEIMAAFVSDLTRVPSIPIDSCLARVSKCSRNILVGLDTKMNDLFDSSSTLTCT